MKTIILASHAVILVISQDDASNELVLGSSFVGIFVINNVNNQPAQYFKWSDVNNLLHNKRVFGIETSLTEKIVQYHMVSGHYRKTFILG